MFDVILKHISARAITCLKMEKREREGEGGQRKGGGRKVDRSVPLSVDPRCIHPNHRSPFLTGAQLKAPAAAVKST